MVSAGRLNSLNGRVSKPRGRERTSTAARATTHATARRRGRRAHGRGSGAASAGGPRPLGRKDGRGEGQPEPAGRIRGDHRRGTGGLRTVSGRYRGHAGRGRCQAPDGG